MPYFKNKIEIATLPPARNASKMACLAGGSVARDDKIRVSGQRFPFDIQCRRKPSIEKLSFVLLLTLSVTMLFASKGGAGVDLDKTIEGTRKDIGEAVAELNREREKISAARKPLVAEIRTLQSELAKLREEAYSLRALRWQKEEAFENLHREVDSLQSEVQFVFSLLSEYRRGMETRTGVAEAQDLSRKLKEVDNLLHSEEETEITLTAIDPLLTIAEVRNRRSIGGDIFIGSCLNEKGVLHQGSFVLLGPVTYFASQDGSLAGLVASRVGSVEPSVIAGISESEQKQIGKLAVGGEALVPVDFTLGDAIKIRALRGSWFEHIKKGGVVMIPILSIGLLCLVLIIWKFSSLRSFRIEVGNELNEILKLLKDEKVDQANELARSLGRPLGPVILEGIEHRRAPREHIEEIIHERILSEIPGLERHLPTLAVCAGAAPLLGLLGTVTGMIHTFNLVTVFGTGDARMLSGGISEALITTEYGLAIAIPVLLIHAFLSRRVRKIIGVLDQTATSFINSIKLK